MEKGAWGSHEIRAWVCDGVKREIIRDCIITSQPSYTVREDSPSTTATADFLLHRLSKPWSDIPPLEKVVRVRDDKQYSLHASEFALHVFKLQLKVKPYSPFPHLISIATSQSSCRLRTSIGISITSHH